MGVSFSNFIIAGDMEKGILTTQLVKDVGIEAKKYIGSTRVFIHKVQP